MPFQATRPRLHLTDDQMSKLATIAVARTDTLAHVERARMLLAYADGQCVSAIARTLRTNRPRVERCIDKALQVGPLAALDDLPRPGKPASITPEARIWVTSLACEKPRAYGYSYELWTTRLLAQHIRDNCRAAGHPSLASLTRGTVSKILRQSQTRPHKITYYVERRDPEFDTKMAQVLYVYRQVELLKRTDSSSKEMVAFLSYDEKPGIQAIANTSPDLPPVPAQHPSIYRDYEYVRHGTVSLLAGIDLMNGHVYGLVRDRHRSVEFIEFLKLVDEAYPKPITVRIVLDNHSAHISKQTRAYLASVPNRFEFVFTPKHGSWLNMIETFFSKMARTMLRGIRVHSKQELAERIDQYLTEVNQTPVVFRWKHGLDDMAIA